MLLTLPALWLVLTGFLQERVWPRTDNPFNDWGAHLQWAGLFVSGVMLAARPEAWRWMEARRGMLALLAVLLGAGLLADHALWLDGELVPPLSWIGYDTLAGLYCCTMILALCGFAARYLNKPSATLSYFNTAILPIYVLHQ